MLMLRVEFKSTNCRLEIPTAVIIPEMKRIPAYDLLRFEINVFVFKFVRHHISLTIRTFDRTNVGFCSRWINRPYSFVNSH